MNRDRKHINKIKHSVTKLKFGIVLGIIGASLVFQSHSVNADDILSQPPSPESGFSQFISEMNIGKKYKNFQKSNADTQTVLKKVKDELQVNKNNAINVRELGSNDTILTQVEANSLVTELQKVRPDFDTEYTFVMVDNSYLGDGVTLYIAKKSGYIINSMQDYSIVLQKLLNGELKEIDIYAPFDIKNNYLNLLLQANGFGIVGDHNDITVNGLSMYYGKLRLSTISEYFSRVNYQNSDRSLRDYLANDEKILALIEESGALKQETEREKVEQWSNFLKGKFHYDQGFLELRSSENYSLGSDIYSLTERNTAMCVGFSVLSARALNMMGIRSYVVYGNTSVGVQHAVTRVFFNNRWHFVDTTTPLNHLVQVTIDTFSEMDKKEFGVTPNGTMRIDKSFEKWAENQNPRHLLLLNTDKAAFTNKRLEYYISDYEKQEMLSTQRLVRNRYEHILSTLNKKSKTNNSLLEKIKGFIKEIDQEIEQVSRYNKMIGSMADKHFNIMDNFNSTAGSIERECGIPEFSDTSKINDSIKKLIEQKNSSVITNKYEVDSENRLKEIENRARTRRSLRDEQEPKSNDYLEMSEDDLNKSALKDVTFVSEIGDKESALLEENLTQLPEKHSLRGEDTNQENTIVNDEVHQDEEIISNELELSGAQANLVENGISTTLEIITQIVSSIWDNINEWFSLIS